MILKDFLEIREIAVDVASPVIFRMIPSIPMACIIGADKTPLKVHDRVQVGVPIHYWETPAEETAAIIRVMAHMAEGLPISALSYAAINRGFWTKLRFNLKAVILNPELRGKFFIPERTVAFSSSVLPLDRVLCLGPPGKSGVVLAQRNRTGYVLPLQSGVTAIRIYNLS